MSAVRTFKILPFLLSFLLLPSTLLMCVSYAQPLSGNWIVIETEVVENMNVILDGDLTIKNGGSLTLRNVTLSLNPQNNGESGILVEKGSSFFVYNSNITSTTSSRFFFSVVNATFVMKDSELGGAGTGSSWDTNGLKIHADNAVIERDFIHNGWGIMLDSAHNSKVINCTLKTDYGLLSRYSTDIWDPSSNNLILGNTILQPYEFGIVVGGHDDVVANNTIIDADGIAIRIQTGHNNLVINNHVVIEQTFDAWAAIVLWDYCYNNTVRGNSILYNHPPDRRGPIYGVDIIHSSYNNIEDNTMFGVQIGVMAFYSYKNVIAYNEITNVTYGTAGTDNIYIPSCDGIQLYHSSGNFIVGNQLSSVDSNAILLWDNSSNNIIRANVINKSYNGIMLHYSADNNTVVNNALSGIVSWEVAADESSGNILHDNNFEDNYLQILDNGRNSWNSSVEGNYWGDYVGIDSDSDGIGDIPYSIPLNGTDWLPLMKAMAIEPFSIPKMQDMDAYLSNGPGNWEQLVVSGSETWRDITLSGVSLHANSGASLTLINVTLKLRGPFHIFEPGASLFIYNSTITVSDPMFGGYQIRLEDPKEFVMKDSKIFYGGYGFSGDMSAINTGGSATKSFLKPRITIENNLFLHNYNTISIFSPGNDQVVNNTISYTYYGVFTNIAVVDGNRISKVIHAGLYGGDGGLVIDQWRIGHRPIFLNNIISNSWGAGVKLNKFQELEVKNNTISDCEEGISVSTAWMLPNKAKISRNSITHSTSWGLHVKVYESHPANITVIDNKLTDCSRAIFVEPMSHGVILYHNIIINSLVAEAGDNRTVDEDTLVELDSSISTDNMRITDYIWTFTDITTKTLIGASVNYTFVTPGIYFITLNVTDEANNFYTDTLTITVKDITSPVAHAGNDKTTKVNTQINFDASSSNDNVGIISYQWNFGDGNTGAGVITTHMYAQTGTYTVTLTVLDAAGNSNTDSATITIQAEFPWTTVVIGAVAIAVIIIFYLIATRRRPSKFI